MPTEENTENLAILVAQAFRRQAYATLALFLWNVALTLAMIWALYGDLTGDAVRIRDQVRQNRGVVRYLCETTTILRVLVVQEKDSLALRLERNALGVNERERIRERVAALEVAAAELSNRQPCREVE